MPINIYGAFRTDTTMTDNTATFATLGATFQISQYSQITIEDGADGSVIEGDNIVNESPNDPTQTYMGEVFIWDYTIEVNDGVNTYQIGVMDWDENGDGDFDFPTAEQGYFLGFIGDVPPLNTTLTVGSVVDNGANIEVDTVVPCFCAGTLIDTPTGPRAIETLSTGDKVVTLDHGPQVIRWIGSRTLDASELARKPRLRPIRIAAGSLGSGLPRRDLLVSPQHRMLIRSNIAIRMFDSEEVLVPAHKLVGIPGITVEEDAQNVVYHHMLFDRHEIVLAEGAPSESLFTGQQALKAIHPEALAEIVALFPELASQDHQPVAARQIPRQGRKIHSLLRRHKKNDRALIRPS